MTRDTLLRVVGAAVGGGLLYAAFPPSGLWLLTPVALGLLYACLAVGRPRVVLGAACGGVFGLAFFLPLLPWVGEFVGAVPWVALSVVMALYLALFGAMATITLRLPGAPLWFAAGWVAVEWLRSSFPFGGFPWGAAAFSQTEGLFLPVARWLGVPGLSFVLALTGAGAAALVIALVHRGPRAMTAAWAAICVAAPLVLSAIALATAPSPGDGETVRVVAVQGNVPRLGLDFNAQRRAVLDNHYRETLRLADDIAAGRREKPDVILWPENASDISPLDNPDAARLIGSAVSATGVPIVFGTLLFGPDGRPTNTVLVWETANGLAASGPSARYDKHIIQPFGEYLPWRDFFAKFSSYAERAGDFRPGTGSAVVPVQTADSALVLGVSTCWEVAFDRSPQQAVRDGAQLLFVPTNNATFGHTDMTYQQLAMSQVRAVETDRSVAVAATSGVSALIAPNGRVLVDSEIFTPALLEADLPLRSGQTLAVRLGPWPQWLTVLCALGGFLYALFRQTRFDAFGARSAVTVNQVDEGTP
ncbi:apolipoprotein N-acyltransferase [Gordonia phosphorivorans]|uniref:Apolipoprotein N-acyltransferase n=1 Tax=Gordonia phosphorivorans TaxID=1056982 RepID=A0ABV6H9S1_9ACTN